MPSSVALRPMSRADFPALLGWLRAPHVEAWFPWVHPDTELPAAAVEAEYGPCIDGVDPTELFVVEVAGRAVGFAQRYRINANPEWAAALEAAADVADAVGIDYAIGDAELIGHGIGTAAIGQLVDDTFARFPDVDSVVVAMQQANRASWRALEKVGFERRWAGLLETSDPSDAGPSFVYVLKRVRVLDAKVR